MLRSLLPKTSLIFLLLTHSVHAASIVPQQKDICVPSIVNNKPTSVVDKQKLITFLLDASGVSRRFEENLPSDTQGKFTSIPARQQLFLRSLCPSDGTADAACTADFQKQYKSDLTSLGSARVGLINILQFQTQSYTNVTGATTPAKFLGDPKAVLICRQDNGVPVEAPGAVSLPPFSYTLPIRVRGNTDGLFYPKEVDQFKSVDPATINFSDDGGAKKRTDKMVGVIGYPIDFFLSGTGALPSNYAGAQHGYAVDELIPYVGVNRSLTNVAHKPTTFNSETANVGLLNSYFRTDHLFDGGDGAPVILGSWFNARSDYLLNSVDDSRLASFNVTYIPIVNGLLNDYIRFIRDRDDLASFRPVFDLRSDNTNVTDKGTTNAQFYRNFNRLGTQFGIAVTSDNPNMPLDILVTHTYLHGLDGLFHNINYFKSSATISLDPKKYFGITLGYSNGRREDTSLREQLWTAGLSVKY